MITEPRFFATERGFQGELLAELRARLHEAYFPGDPVVEQEYQKRMREHDIRIRPDLIVHIPFERGLTRVRAALWLLPVWQRPAALNVNGSCRQLRSPATLLLDERRCG